MQKSKIHLRQTNSHFLTNCCFTDARVKISPALEKLQLWLCCNEIKIWNVTFPKSIWML